MYNNYIIMQFAHFSLLPIIFMRHLYLLFLGNGGLGEGSVSSINAAMHLWDKRGGGGGNTCQFQLSSASFVFHVFSYNIREQRHAKYIP